MQLMATMKLMCWKARSTERLFELSCTCIWLWKRSVSGVRVLVEVRVLMEVRVFVEDEWC